jgi:hypothetical protein
VLPTIRSMPHPFISSPHYIPLTMNPYCPQVPPLDPTNLNSGYYGNALMNLDGRQASHLRQYEIWRRMELNICHYCREHGHWVCKCPHRKPPPCPSTLKASVLEMN